MCTKYCQIKYDQKTHILNINVACSQKTCKIIYYCKSVLYLTQSYTYIISWFFFSTWTRTYVKTKYAGKCTKNEKFNTQVNLLKSIIDGFYTSFFVVDILYNIQQKKEKREERNKRQKEEIKKERGTNYIVLF